MHKQQIRRVPGSKMAVLMIHGIVGSPNHFAPFLPQIPEEWSLYNILLDGHGGSVQDFSRTSMKKWKKQVNSVLEQILSENEQVVILGHSMGCLFAVQTAVQFPDRVAQLFLLSIPLRLQIPFSTVASTLRIAFDRVRPQDTVAQRMRSDGGVALEPGLLRYIPWAPRFVELLLEMGHTERQLSQLRVPVQAYHGLKDELVSRRSCTVMEKKAAIRCTELPDSGHFTYADRDLALLKAGLQALIAQYR